MTDVDTSAGEVERLAGALENEAAHMNHQVNIDAMNLLAATLRALARERDALAAKCAAWQAEVIEATETAAAAVRERDEARAALEQMRAPYAIIAKREWQAGAEAMREKAAVFFAPIISDAIRCLSIPERPE